MVDRLGRGSAWREFAGGESREELLSNLREALAEAIEMNREDARKAAGEQFEEVVLQP